MKIASFLLVVFAAILSAFAQSDVNLDQGMKPYGSYMGGNLDTVSLTNGNLMLHIPLVSYPQRGSRLSLGFYLRYNNKGFGAVVNGTATWAFDGIGVDVQRTQLVETRTRRTQFAVPGDNGTAHIFINTTTATTADGSIHDISWSGEAKAVTAGPIDGSALGQRGVIHHLIPNASITVDPSCQNSPISTWDPVVSEDPNGNQIITNALGWTDTMGRIIPGQAQCPVRFSSRNTDQGIYAGAGNALDAIKTVGVRMLPGVRTSDLSACPTNSVSARLWLLPTFANSSSPSSGTTASMTFCYANFAVSSDFGLTGTSETSGTFTMLQNVVLPNGTMWSFSYNSHGDLASITFPTGGTITYEWANIRFCSGASRALVSRTVTDATGPHKWSYVWSPGVWTNFNFPPPPTTVTVTDPELNDSVHVSTSMGACSYYETHGEYYQGSQQSGTLLKKVDTAYITFADPMDEYVQSSNVGVFPTTTTTTWANGSVNKEQIDYDPPTTYTAWDLLCYNCADTPRAMTQTRINGQVAGDSIFDYGTGSPGPLLRKTAASYLTLDDPSSSITYDGNGNKCAETDFAYDDPGRLVPSNVSQSHVTPYTGAVRANPSSVTRWLSTTPCVTNATWSTIPTYSNFFDTGEIKSSTDALSNVTEFSYDPIFYGAYLTQTNFPDTVTNGATFHHVISGNYDFNTGMTRTFTDQNNNSSGYLFDNMWRLTNATFPDGGQIEFNYPDVLTVEKKQLQNAQTGVWIDQFFGFDGFGRQTQTQLKHPGGDVFTTTTYDGLGRASVVSNPHHQSASATDGNTSTLFDALKRPTRITKQDNNVSTMSYFGSCVTTSDEAGKARRACSDGAGRVTEVDEPGDSSAPASNIPGSSASVVIGGPGEQSKFIPAPRPTPCHPINLCPPPDGSGGSDTTLYDAGTIYVTANGHTDQVPFGQGDTFQTIAANLASVINADGSASVTAQASGSTITLYPRSSGTSAYFSLVCPATTWESSQFASPSFTTTCTGAAPVFSGHAYVTLYTYDPLGNLLCVEQHGNVSGTGCSAAPSSDATSPWRVRRFTYDSLSRLLTATNPESGQIIYQYNASGDLISKTDARGVMVNYSPPDMPIDPLHRVREKTYSNNDPAVTFLYDQAENGIGRLAATSNGSTSAAYAYDQMGRIKNQTYCFPSTCVDSLPVSAKYDQAGNMTQLTYPSGRGINYAYNSANLLNSVQFALWNGQAPQYGVYSYMSVDDADFLPSGLPARTVLGNGITATQAQNNRLQLATESTVGAGNLIFEGRTYTYGSQNNGNVLGITDQLNSNRNQTFTYDALNRLFTANEGRWGLGFVYDPWGNRLQQNLTAGTAGQSQLVVNVNNRVNGYSFDSDGNMLNDGFHQYAYDAENRITTVDTTAAVYTYGPGGERMRKDAAGVGTKYLYFNGSVIAEKDVTTGNWSDYIFAAGKRVARATNFEHQLHISGVECANCGWQWYQFIVNNLGLASGHTIQAGDRLRWGQWQNTGSAGGIIITFTDGTDSCCSSGPILADQNGDQIARTSVVNRWDYRIANLDPVVGKTISQIRLYADGTTQPGQWDIYFQDLVFTGADGSIQPLYSQNATLPSLTGFGSTGMTQTSATIHDCVGAGCAPINTTTYYHGDQIDSSRLLTNGTGYPVWQGTFLPFGEEYNAEATTNHYKFTGKERDSESGLDYFGGRYFSSAMGRWSSADPKGIALRHLLNPQKLNKYGYVLNNPVGAFDPDGMEEVTITYRTFIPTPSVTVAGRTNGGDNRGFSTAANASSRTSITIKIETDPKIRPGNPIISVDGKVGGNTGHAGQSTILDNNGNVTKTATATTGLPTATGTRDANGTPVVNIQQDTGNPLSPAPAFLTPGISANLNVMVYQDASTVQVSGTAAQFPASELNVTREDGTTTPVIQYMPPPDATPWSLMKPDRDVNETKATPK